ncbi:MAG: CBS domain-containing protein, partial [Firmicutes bacterium]|nr:CBS domain-containing protein [Bacillota bacterium]
VYPGSLNKNVQEYVALYKDLLPVKTLKEIELTSVTKLVVTDTRQRTRIGMFARQLDKLTQIHLYDHHPDSDNDLTAEWSLVENIGATTTLLLEKIFADNIAISPFEATLFAMGIYEDTGCLTFESTTFRDVDVLHRLWQVGVNLRVVNEFLNRPLNEEQRDILDELLAATEYHELRGVRVGVASTDNGDYVSGLGLLTHKLLELEDVDMMFTVVSMENKVYVVGRSRVEYIDVVKILRSFGGKGHRSAASALVRELEVEEVRDNLVISLYREIMPAKTAGEMMSAPARTIAPDTTIDEARELMLRYGHSGFPVAEGQALLGIISRRDLDKASHHGLGHAPVKGYMSRKPVTVPSEMPMREVQHMMIENDVGRLPVMVGETIIGIITRTDVLRNLEGIKPLQQSKQKNLPAVGDDLTVLINERLPQKMQSLLFHIGQTADHEDVKVHAVGGFIRDLILEMPTHDLDLVVEPLAIPFAEQLQQMLGGQLITHEQFGTATLTLLDGSQIDLVTARHEFYAYPAAMPEVEQSSLKNDLFRRDFTINTLAVALNSPHFGQLIDFFAGLCDVQDGLIRVLYNLSFVEDPLRVLRAIRFEQRFAFQLEETTQSLLENAVQTRVLEKVSKERLYDEFSLIFHEEEIPKILDRIFTLGVSISLFPGVRYGAAVRKRLFAVQEMLLWVEQAWRDASPLPDALYLAALMLEMPFQEARHLCRRLRLPREVSRRLLAALTVVPHVLAQLVTNESPQPSQLDQWFRGQPVEALLLLQVASDNSRIWKSVTHYWEKIRLQKTEINGHDLEALGFAPGPTFQEILTAVRAAKLDGLVTNREEELAFARARMQHEPVLREEN